MEKYDYIEDVIFTVDEGNVVKQAKPVVLPSLLLLLGVVAAYFGTTLKEAEGDLLSSLLLVVGLVIVVTGITLFIVKKGAYLHRSSGKKLKKHKIYIAPDQSFKLQQVLNDKAYDKLKALRQPNESNLSVEIFLSEDQEYALLQALEFIPYNDVPTTAVIVCRGEEARAVASAIAG
ncbi:MAG: hypothetical protein LBI96_06820 [Odoribacteraceae bacterium]|jgi:hypothetical protein|nr:hypothetical protein [Odoribacteraceae bacterium]